MISQQCAGNEGGRGPWVDIGKQYDSRIIGSRLQCDGVVNC